MRDFEAYYAAGQAANAGIDPYSAGIWRFERPLDGGREALALLPFVSPPATLPLWRALALLPFGLANALWRTALAACIAVLICCALALCRQAQSPRPFLAALCIALGFGPLTGALALGQTALPAYAAAVLSLVAAPAALFAWLQPNIALALFSRLGRNRTLWTLLGASVLGLTLGASYLQTLAAHALAERFSAIQLTPEAIAFGFGASSSIASALAVAIALISFAAWIFCMARMREPLERFCASCALLPLGMPFFHEHDLVVTFLPALYLALRCAPRLWPLAMCGGLLCAIDWLGLAQRPDGAAQTALLAAAFLAGAFALRDLPVRALAIPASIAALALALAIAGAYAHPLPVWPDAMGSPGNLSGASAATAWHAEQAATGLFVRVWAWSALRVLSLLGCVLLTLALLLQSRSDVDVHHVVERGDAVGAEVL